MNKKEVLVSLAAIANGLDAQGEHNSASALTDVMRRVSQSTPWWQNEAGEPMYSPEAIRAEENFQPDYDPYVNLDGRYDSDDGTGEAQTERFNEIYDYWASQQPDMELLQAQYADNLMKEAMAQASPEIEMRKQRFPNFDGERYLTNKYWSLMNPDLKSDLEQFVLANSHHKNWSGDPDTIHDILDAAKAAILNGADRAGIQVVVNSVLGGEPGYYKGPEDFGGRED